MTRIPPGELPADVVEYRGDPNRPCLVVARKCGLTEWHGRLLEAIERIADYYDTLPPIKGSRKTDNA